MRIGIMLRTIDETGGIGVYTRNIVEELLRIWAVRMNTSDWDTWGTTRGKNCYHFRSSFAPMATCERLLRPLSWMLGFRLDLPLEMVSDHPRLEITRIRRTNILGLWKLVEARVIPLGGHA